MINESKLWDNHSPNGRVLVVSFINNKIVIQGVNGSNVPPLK